MGSHAPSQASTHGAYGDNPYAFPLHSLQEFNNETKLHDSLTKMVSTLDLYTGDYNEVSPMVDFLQQIIDLLGSHPLITRGLELAHFQPSDVIFIIMKTKVKSGSCVASKSKPMLASEAIWRVHLHGTGELSEFLGSQCLKADAPRKAEAQYKEFKS